MKALVEDDEEEEREVELKSSKKKQKEVTSSNTIADIISLQSTEGFWKDIDLVGTLYSKELQAKVQKEQGKMLVLVITYLVAKWIEKHHPSKQYSLLVKKAFNYIKKQVGDVEKFALPYQQYTA